MGGPFLGVIFHWIGGFAAASFYVPYRQVRKWSWETYWLVGGVFSWIMVPWALALMMTEDLFQVLGHAPTSSLAYAWIFGVMWGMGGLTFGLTMRYLGLSLGMGVALGLCAAFGTLIPPIFSGEITAIAASRGGQLTLLGVLVCLVGILIAALAGLSKEREMSAEKKRETIKEFNFKKGILVAIFSGIMSASFAYGLAAAEPIAKLSADAGTRVLWTGLPKLVVVLLGGFTSNAIWCLTLNIRNRSGHEYFSRYYRATKNTTSDTQGPNGEPSPDHLEHSGKGLRIPRLSNYLFCALAGTTWYLQFFFYSMGETQMGDFQFSSWTLHMASIIIFSTLWGVALKEWAGSSLRTHILIAAGIATLILSTLIVGYGNYLGAGTGSH